MDALEAAQAFLDTYYPDSTTAFLGGSVVRGDQTATSDLDIFLIAEREDVPYRKSYRAFGWPIEAFVHTPTSYREFFGDNFRRRRPTAQMLCAEGIVLRDRVGLAQQIKAEARWMLDQGPEPLTAEEVVAARYRITDILHDFIGSERYDESIFIAGNLAAEAANLVLAYNRQWIGYGKWIPRALHMFDPVLAQQLAVALHAFFTDGSKRELIAFCEQALALAGGELFEGYYEDRHIITIR